MSDDRLDQARKRIDVLDEEIQALISERALIAQDVARIKADMGDGADCYRPSREAEVLRRVAERNKGPILEALRTRLPVSGRLLELACGALQHARHIAPHFPRLRWQPTDIDMRVLAAAPAYREALGENWPSNLALPRRLDTADRPWPVDPVDVIYTANLLHISPPAVTEAVFPEAARLLAPDGRLFIYGPFRESGRYRSEGDRRFDASLRAQDPAWGIRDVDDLFALATDAGLCLASRTELPANNLLLEFSR